MEKGLGNDIDIIFQGPEVDSLHPPALKLETRKDDHSPPPDRSWRSPQMSINDSKGTESAPEPEGWPKMYKYLRDYDEMKVKDSKEDIDTLLVFAGLFSAILTAFVIVSYGFLQQDNTAVSVQLLAQISTQLTAMLANGNIANATLPPISTTSSFSPPASALRINGLWFASLTFSLITASLGMLVKQWLREYMAGEMISPRERCRVRHFRHEGMIRCRVFEIAAFLPMLLQLALILFFIGLLDFIRLANAAICWAISSIVALYLLFYAVTAVSPIFSAQSPFKTPLLSPVFCIVRTLMMRFVRHMSRQHLGRHEYTGSPEEFELRKRGDLDVSMIVAADATFMDPEFIDNIQLCVRDLGSTRMVLCVRQMMEHRAGRPVPSLQATESAFWGLSGPERLASVSILMDALHMPLVRVRALASEHDGTYRQLPWSPWMDEAIFGLHMAIRAGLDLGSRTISPPDLIHLLLSYSPEFAQQLLKHLSRVRVVTLLRVPGKRVSYLPQSLSSQGMENFLDAATELFVSKECKPIILWSLILRFLRNLPDDELCRFEQKMLRLTELAARAITENILSCHSWEYLHLRGVAASDTAILAQRTAGIAGSLLPALHESQWEGPQLVLEQRKRTYQSSPKFTP